MTQFASKKLLISGVALLALGAVFVRKATADNHPAPVATWNTLFGPEDDAAWNNLMYVRGLGGSTTYTWFSRPVGVVPPGSGTVIKGSGGLIVGVAPPPISPWKP